MRFFASLRGFICLRRLTCLRRWGAALGMLVLAMAGLGGEAWAASGHGNELNIRQTDHVWGLVAILVFVLAYAAVMAEEFIHLRKSKPVILAAGIIWALLAVTAMVADVPSVMVLRAFEHTFLEFAELFVFLLVAMTYINAMTERNVFNRLRHYLLYRKFSLIQIYWITGVLAFFISPLADNLTTAILMCAVVLAIGKGRPRFVTLACINIVVAANAGGAFSPFGDITTLMVWQANVLDFFAFLDLFVPSALNYLVPALCMHFALPKTHPAKPPSEKPSDWQLKRGAAVVVGLFLATIVTTVSMHNFFHLPPALGMMTGFSYLGFYSYYLNWRMARTKGAGQDGVLDVFQNVARSEWDTLLFFYGVILCVGGLGAFGYLEIVAAYSYEQWGAFAANSAVGVLSAILDNIPVMFAVLTMFPSMDHGQWLLVTLTTGTGGSLLSIGSAAGVALMGLARGQYTFFSHLRWSWAIALGYALSIAALYWLHTDLFNDVPIVVE